MKKKDSLIKSFVPSILVVLAYAVSYCGFLANDYFENQIQLTYNSKYWVYQAIVSIFIYLFVGIVVAYISSIKKRNIIAIIVEIVLIDIPTLIFCLLPIFYYVGLLSFIKVTPFTIKLLNYKETLYVIAAVFLGCEILRIIKSFKKG